MKNKIKISKLVMLFTLLLASSCGLNLKDKLDASSEAGSSQSGKVSFDNSGRSTAYVWGDSKIRIEAGTSVAITVDASSMSTTDGFSYAIVDQEGVGLSMGPLSYIASKGVSFQERSRALSEVKLLILKDNDVVGEHSRYVNADEPVRLKFEL
jgi:hypothetical protein